MHSKLVYDSSSDYQARVAVDYERVVNRDEKGVEHVVYEPVDYPRIQASLGFFKDWSLRSLIDAGIDPDFPIKTGFNTGLAREVAVLNAVDAINSVVDSENKSE